MPPHPGDQLELEITRLAYGGQDQDAEDGIAHTPDDNVPYLDTNNDGIPDSTWYDADGDGVVDLNYNYNTSQVGCVPDASKSLS